MSTRTHTKSRTSAPDVSTCFDSPRELHHAEENHNGSVSDCHTCDRFELAQYNGYVDGLATWFDEVGQFMDGITESIGTVL